MLPDLVGRGELLGGRSASQGHGGGADGVRLARRRPVVDRPDHCRTSQATPRRDAPARRVAAGPSGRQRWSWTRLGFSLIRAATPTHDSGHDPTTTRRRPGGGGPAARRTGRMAVCVPSHPTTNRPTRSEQSSATPRTTPGVPDTPGITASRTARGGASAGPGGDAGPQPGSGCGAGLGAGAAGAARASLHGLRALTHARGAGESGLARVIELHLVVDRGRHPDRHRAGQHHLLRGARPSRPAAGWRPRCWSRWSRSSCWPR